MLRDNPSAGDPTQKPVRWAWRGAPQRILDQAPVRDVDVIDGLENTLVLLNSKLKEGIRINREYEEGLPRISAYSSELNQVWTNVIDNAVDVSV